MVPIDGLGGAKPPRGLRPPDPPSKSSTSGSSGGPGETQDRAEISDLGLVLVALKGVPPTREDLVNAIKTAISRGEFDADTVPDGALPGLSDDVSRS